jgi:uncharacterized protein
MRWLNGGGWTSEIVAWPDPTNWQWRLSIADVERAGPFSTFPDVDRTIALLVGEGFSLTVGESQPVTIAKRYDPFEFRGDDITVCALVDGPVQDLNLMVRRSTPPKRVEFVEVVKSVELVGVDIVVVVSGHVRIEDGANTEPGELARLDAALHEDTKPFVMTPVGGPAVIAIVTRIVAAS